MDAWTMQKALEDIPGEDMEFEDHEGGRIKVLSNGEHIATLGPGRLMALDQEAFLLSYPDSNEEWRGSWASITAGLAVFRMTGDWYASGEAKSAVTWVENRTK